MCKLKEIRVIQSFTLSGNSEFTDKPVNTQSDSCMTWIYCGNKVDILPADNNYNCNQNCPCKQQCRGGHDNKLNKKVTENQLLFGWLLNSENKQ